MADILSDLTTDLNQIDPDTIDLGTELQDCATIAQAFERAAHSTPTEAAVFATFTRSLMNMQSFSQSAVDSLGSYLKAPQDSADTAVAQATSLSASAGVSPNDTQVNAGTKAQTDNFLQNLRIGESDVSTLGDSFGGTLLDWARDCIPCSLRIEAFLELNPSLDLLTTLEEDLQNKLDIMMSMLDMLRNFSMFGDFCSLLNLLSDTCPPDLQRIIATLMALFMLEVPELDGLIGLIQSLIAPMFSPILMSITTLLDQFVSLVTKPLECVIDEFERQITKLEFDTSFNTGASTARAAVDMKDVQQSADNARDQIEALKSELNEFQEGLTSVMKKLTEKVDEAKRAIEGKLDFYLSEVKALLNDFGLGDASYLRLSLRKLEMVRLITFISAIIEAMAKGHAACSGAGKTPEKSEIDNFLETFLNPNSPFKMWIGDDGLVHIDEKIEGEDDMLLSNDGNVFKFEGDDLLDPTVAQVTERIGQAATQPVSVSLPCLSTSQEDAEKVNQWITDLNKL